MSIESVEAATWKLGDIIATSTTSSSERNSANGFRRFFAFSLSLGFVR
jgi:hypothetical protein